jgi:hypothetical protein
MSMDNDIARLGQSIPANTPIASRPLSPERMKRIRQINLQLAATGQPLPRDGDDDLLDVAEDLLRNYRQHRRLLRDYRCPSDQRIQDFVNDYLARNGVETRIQLPAVPFILDRPGLAAELSLPLDGDRFESRYLTSYRVRQGVLHNPGKDRRTTEGVFHSAEGGLPIPWDKKAVPAATFAALMRAALDAPDDLLRLPYTANHAEGAHLWVSLLLRPLVSPEVEGVQPAKTMETRFFAPGGLVSNLDFVERIFGNAGDPYLPENDAGLDVIGWSGHSGCVILAPHLTTLRKKDVGLPHWDIASERQRRDGMCWKDEAELYNDGSAFKLVCRDMRGVIVTLIADNYFGYSKKEIKSQISYAANLFGGSEEEHSGGALAFPTYNLGESYEPDSRLPDHGHTLAEVLALLGDQAIRHPEGHASDTRLRNVHFVPEDARFDISSMLVSWGNADSKRQIKLLAGHTYIYPCGYKIQLEKHPHAPTWRLLGTEAEGTFCYKPCTVSGGGKSEISKSLDGALLSGPFFIKDLKEDLDQVEAIFQRDYSDRFKVEPKEGRDTRSVLSARRSVGSVVRLLTPSETEYTPEYNAWVESIPQRIRSLVFIIKRFYRQDWGDNWRERFSVDQVNGQPAHELKFQGRQLVASYLRVGRLPDGSWRVFKLRQNFVGARKVQLADDIAVATTLPASQLDHLNPAWPHPSLKLVDNCEARLFQRPDEAKHRGMDPQTEIDLTEADNFISNFAPLNRQDARDLVDDVVEFTQFTEPMRQFIQAAADAVEDGWFVSSAHPRIVNGKPSPNVRYLQARPDLANPRERYLAELGTRLQRRIHAGHPVYFPVNAVLPGRRNNPPAPGIKPLAVYGPIHYQELPELFMDFIASLSGKSPSTTGAGSEGALTKGPFNALSTTADLNNALVSFILCGYPGFSSAAGFIGRDRRVDHDVSYLIPEIWSRLAPREQDPAWLIARGYLEKLEDFDHDGQRVLASRLGYRITSGFAHAFLGKIFDSPMAVFDEAMLKPESQDLAAYVDGIQHIVASQRQVAQGYLNDESVEDACPPLKALLHIMADGNFEGKDISDPEIRDLFSRESLLTSDWYRERLDIKQQRDIALAERQVAYLMTFLEGDARTRCDPDQLGPCQALLAQAKAELARVSGSMYRESLWGSLGADWVHRGA